MVLDFDRRRLFEVAWPLRLKNFPCPPVTSLMSLIAKEARKLVLKGLFADELRVQKGE